MFDLLNDTFIFFYTDRVPSNPRCLFGFIFPATNAKPTNALKTNKAIKRDGHPRRVPV